MLNYVDTQRALYESGMTGIPIFNVNNNCATGSSALYLANQLVQGGMADCVLALGFEKMQKGSLGVGFTVKLGRNIRRVPNKISFQRWLVPVCKSRIAYEV